MKAELQRVLDWADGKLATGAEPPWAWYQYAKLREAVEEVIACLEASTPQVDSLPRAGTHRNGGLRLVVSNDLQDTAERQASAAVIRLPM